MSALEHLFRFDADTGTFSITAGGYGLRGASCQALLDNHDLDSALMEVELSGPKPVEMPGMGRGQMHCVQLRHESGVHLELEAFVPDDAYCVVLTQRLHNRSSVAQRVLALAPLVVEGEVGTVELGGRRGNWMVLREGWQSGSPTGLVRPGDISPPPDDDGGRLAAELVNLADGGAVVSDRVTVIRGRLAADSKCLLVGWLECRNHYGKLVVNDERLAALLQTEWTTVAVAGTLESPPLVVMLGDYSPPLLEWYGEQFGRRMGATALLSAGGAAGGGAGAAGGGTQGRAVSGWLSSCSGPAGSVSAEYLSRILQQYLVQADRWRLTTWIIDDGWQSAVGDWLLVSQSRFPRGLKGVADEIRHSGLEPGIWIAPFLVGQSSVAAREHPQWLVRDNRGEPVALTIAGKQWAGRPPQCVLDVTHPDAAQYIEQMMRTVAVDWGFSLILADRIAEVGLAGVRHDASVGSCQLVRRGLEIVRRAIGERFLLAGGCPAGPAVGIVDAMRTSAAVAEKWYNAASPSASAGGAVSNAIGRYWQHNRLYLNDAGVLTVRQVETSLNVEEVRTLATVVAMSGGLALWRDLPDSVSEQRRTILDKILPVWPHAARPVDLMLHAAETSALHWRFTQSENSWDVVAVVNLSDRQTDAELPLALLGLDDDRGRYHAFELWRESYLGRVRGELLVRAIPPHGVRVVALRPVADGLCFLGSNLHLTMDAFFCSVQQRGLACDVRLSSGYPRRGRLFLWAPPGYAVRTSSGELTARRDGSWSIEVDTTTVTDYNFEAVRRG